jgi:hypothetical protein
MADQSPDNKDDPLVNTGIKVRWSKSIEKMLAAWCDQAKCFEWMHTQAFSLFDKKSRIIMICSNVLTAVSGLTNVIAGGISVDGVPLAYLFGSLSIAVSIANMLQEKLAYGASAIEHRQFSATWGVIRRKIEEELSIPPESRKECGTFLKFLRQDINAVSSAGAVKIPQRLRDECYKKFSNIPDFEIPDICGSMEHTKVYVREADEPFLSHEGSKIEVSVNRQLTI